MYINICIMYFTANFLQIFLKDQIIEKPSADGNAIRALASIICLIVIARLPVYHNTHISNISAFKEVAPKYSNRPICPQPSIPTIEIHFQRLFFRHPNIPPPQYSETYKPTIPSPQYSDTFTIVVFIAA